MKQWHRRNQYISSASAISYQLENRHRRRHRRSASAAISAAKRRLIERKSREETGSMKPIEKRLINGISLMMW